MFRKNKDSNALLTAPVKIIEQKDDLLKLQMSSGKYVAFHYMPNGNINIVLPYDTEDNVMQAASIVFEDLFCANCISTESKCVRLAESDNNAKAN